MTIFRNLDNIEGTYTACIGFFDGVHCGHRFLLEHLRKEAVRTNTLSAVITFAIHPRKLIQPEYNLELINTLEEKLENLSQTGIDVCFLLEFTPEIRNLTAQEFICDFLSAKMHVKNLLIGYDHRFGKNRAEGFDDYVRYGKTCSMNVIEEPVFNGAGSRNYSSSEVRRSLISGNIKEATCILGNYYSIEGVVVHGKQLGRKLGFPTANLMPDNKEKIIPVNGVYAGKVFTHTGEEFAAMINIGYRPTIENNAQKLSIEAHLLDFDGDLYEKNIRVYFFERLRDERKMSSLEELKQQLTKDCNNVRNIVKEYGL